jgi:hypothetical protein
MTVMIDNVNKTITKKEKARELYKKYHNLPRKEIAYKFVEELLMPIESALTHVSLCAKELNSSLNKPFVTRKHNPDKLKKAKAYNIFSSNPQLSRKQMITEFQSQLNMTENSAATHCSMCAKEFKKSNSITHASIL